MNIVLWVENPLTDREKYRLFREFSIVNSWRAYKDQKILERRARGESLDAKFDYGGKRKKNKKSKEQRASRRSGFSQTIQSESSS